ncbi:MULTISPECIES: hypothetical protein [unclassified Pseudoalteromonas]|uniref:hypothetical protein n=1 Tax=unclassified Pseudoalteromonas TaxID=194690 RepID=UPI0018CDA1AE|nr:MULTISPECIES: hypothetical protein [unclassified Pseudoalteromonas]MBH0060085.1 hypothetical protein [Pseudoalteromonas sp. NZS71]MBH0066715.1 hypothetical protein [Pseudoalteromonas sp. NZS100]
MNWPLSCSIAQFERRLISEQTKAGLDANRDKKAMLNDPQITKAEVAEHFGISRTTLNEWLNKQ